MKTTIRARQAQEMTLPVVTWLDANDEAHVFRASVVHVRHCNGTDLGPGALVEVDGATLGSGWSDRRPDAAHVAKDTLFAAFINGPVLVEARIPVCDAPVEWLAAVHVEPLSAAKATRLLAGAA
jgi:hypothetical protein